MILRKWLCKLNWHSWKAMRSPIQGIAFVLYCPHCKKIIEKKIPRLDDKR